MACIHVCIQKSIMCVILLIPWITTCTLEHSVPSVDTPAVDGKTVGRPHISSFTYACIRENTQK